MLSKNPMFVCVATIKGLTPYLQCAYWPESLLETEQYDFKTGEKVFICSDRDYLISACGQFYVPDILKLSGKICEIDGFEVPVSGISGIRIIVGGLKFPASCLIPCPKASGGSSDELSGILESLYDHAGSSASKVAHLLERYKELTGRDKPGFMYGYPGI